MHAVPASTSALRAQFQKARSILLTPNCASTAVLAQVYALRRLSSRDNKIYTACRNLSECKGACVEYTRPFSFWLLRQEKFSSYERIPAHYNKKHNTHSCGYCGVSAIYVPVSLVTDRVIHKLYNKKFMAATRRWLPLFCPLCVQPQLPVEQVHI